MLRFAPSKMVRRRSSGFTLMETLVMLVLVSFAVSLMFQMLGNYRIAKERVVESSGGMTRRALLEAWFIESVRGLQAIEGLMLEGSRDSFHGVSLGPLLASPGAPTAIGWSLVRDEGDMRIAYAEAEEERWQLPFREDVGSAAFVYLDQEGRTHDQWPPAQGQQSLLPAAIGLVFERDTPAERLIVAGVRGDLEPQLYSQVFELEQD